MTEMCLPKRGKSSSLDKPMESGSLLTALAEIVRNNSVRQE